MKESHGFCEYAVYVQGLLARRAGKLHDALALFQDVARLNPKNINAAKQVARCLFLLGRHKAAIDVYNETIQLGLRDWVSGRGLVVATDVPLLLLTRPCDSGKPCSFAR